MACKLSKFGVKLGTGTTLGRCGGAALGSYKFIILSAVASGVCNKRKDACNLPDLPPI